MTQRCLPLHIVVAGPSSHSLHWMLTDCLLDVTWLSRSTVELCTFIIRCAASTVEPIQWVRQYERKTCSRKSCWIVAVASVFVQLMLMLQCGQRRPVDSVNVRVAILQSTSHVTIWPITTLLLASNNYPANAQTYGDTSDCRHQITSTLHKPKVLLRRAIVEVYFFSHHKHQ